ncbi:UNVERIFIED_CONTAM: hypothetical protein HDU68_008468 [Siphonaria sp. JEL0065]|nr:hypothetical protein HDU68_008468 [Siphonaria sp. JEL0065]
MPFFTFFAQTPSASPPPLPKKNKNKDNPLALNSVDTLECREGISKRSAKVPQPVLTSPRLKLVPLLSLLPRISNESELAVLSAAREWATVYSATKQTQKLGSGSGPASLQWAMLLHSQPTFIGLVELVPFNDTATLKLNVDPNYCGNGFSTEAAKAILQHLFSTSISKVNSVFEASFPERQRAESVLERLGFTLAEHVSPSMRRDGTAVEGWTLWEISRDEFKELWES